MSFKARICPIYLITFEYVSSVYLVNNFVETGVIAICNNCVRDAFEPIKVIDNLTTKECGAILKGWLIDDDLCALGLYPLHDTLN